MNQEPLHIRYIKFGSGPRLPKDPPPSPPERTLSEACVVAGVSVLDVLNPRGYKKAVRARWHVMTVLRSWGRSTPQIGRMLGGMDHTSVLHGLKKWAEISAPAMK